jgi:penicillin-binding protein-related factor A (putative recombinase)
MSNPFETEISRSFKKLPGWYKKITTPAAAGPDVEQRFNLKTEFDHVYCSFDGNIAVECKKVESSSFAFAGLKDHQEAGLSKFLMCAGPAYVIINFRHTKKKHKLKLNFAFALLITEYLAAKDRALAGEFGRAKKSLNLSWFHENARELKRIHDRNPYWDLSPLLKGEIRDQ